jgi:hypothetical protein
VFLHQCERRSWARVWYIKIQTYHTGSTLWISKRTSRLMMCINIRLPYDWNYTVLSEYSLYEIVKLFALHVGVTCKLSPCLKASTCIRKGKLSPYPIADIFAEVRRELCNE